VFVLLWAEERGPGGGRVSRLERSSGPRETFVLFCEDLGLSKCLSFSFSRVLFAASSRSCSPSSSSRSIKGPRLLHLPRLGCACYFPSISYSYINIPRHTSHITTTQATITFELSHYERLLHSIAPPSFVGCTYKEPANKSSDPTQRHGVFGSVYCTNRTVGDTARHCDHGLLSFSLFPGSVCEHCLFLFCTLASVRIDHGMRAGE
jgi:hypothetical protein